jgi:hypothetical protein
MCPKFIHIQTAPQNKTLAKISNSAVRPIAVNELYQSVTTEVLATFSAIWLQTGYESSLQGYLVASTPPLPFAAATGVYLYIPHISYPFPSSFNAFFMYIFIPVHMISMYVYVEFQ